MDHPNDATARIRRIDTGDATSAEPCQEPNSRSARLTTS